MVLSDRADNYNREFVKYPASRLQYSGGQITGVWMIGNDYSGSGFYGSYPPGYLKRMMALFPDKKRVLHLFAGSLPEGNYERVDINPELKPDIVVDAHRLGRLRRKFDVIFADPPYSKEDAMKYGYPMVNRYKVIQQCALSLSKGGFLVWLDTVWPMHSKKELKLVGLIAIVRSTNHRVRLVSFFERV